VLPSYRVDVSKAESKLSKSDRIDDKKGNRPVELESTLWETVPPWADVLRRDESAWKAARAAAKAGPKVLITNVFGTDPSIVNVTCMMAIALTLRGADVHLLFCDGSLPACWVSQFEFVNAKEFALSGPPRSLCDRCSPGVAWAFNSLGLSVHRHSELITSEEIKRCREISSSLPMADISSYQLDGLHVGEHANAGALRYLGRGDFAGEVHGEGVLRRYLDAALETVFVTRRLMSTDRFTSVMSPHGMYVPEGLICEVARQNDVRIAAWSFAYRKGTSVFSHGDSYHHTLLSEPVSVWENMHWTPEMEKEIVGYLNSRRYGTRDWIRFNQNPQEDITAIASELGLDLSKPIIGLLTNVIWDAQLTYRNNAFSSMLEWILVSIRYFAAHPELQLVIRVHPGELLANTRARQTVVEEIRNAFPSLPGNVFVIPPESSIGTYATMTQCNAVIIYGTKTGVELTSIGIPVIVAGEAWIRNKGVTMDAHSPAQYLELLDQLPLAGRLSPEVVTRSRKYAYHFFYRRMIPMPFKGGSMPAPDVDSLNDLSVGRHAGLDVICNGILHGSDFVYPAELYPIPIDEPAKATQEGLARGSFRVAHGLGMLGENKRMRAQMLRALEDFSDVIEDSWARPLIAQLTLRFARASVKPIAAVQDLSQEMSTVTAKMAVEKQRIVSRAVADVLLELGIEFWKLGSYGRALSAAIYAGWYSPSHLFHAEFMKRVARYLRFNRPFESEKS